MRLKSKYLLLLIVMAVPLTVSLLIAYQQIRQQIKDNLIAAQFQLMNQLNISLQNAVIEVDDKLMSVYESPDIYDYLTNPYGYSLQGENRMVSLLQVLALSLREANNVFLYLNDEHLWYEIEYQDLSLQKSTELTGEERQWLDKTRNRNGAMTINYSFDQPSGQLIIGRSITDVIRKTYIGVLGIDLNPRFFESVLADQISNRDAIEVINAEGTALYTTLAAPIDKRGMIAVKSSANRFGWRVIQYIPNVFLARAAWDAIKYTIYLGGMMIAVAALMWLSFSRQISGPIVRLVRSMKDVGNGDFKLVLSDGRDASRGDEIGFLARQFQSMVRKLDELIQSQYELKLQESYSRVKALQAQINPHFLYNTLTAIYSEALDAGSETICSMIKSLSSMFRYTIESGEDIVPLGREIEHVRNYLQIQQFRFEKNLEYRIEAAEHLLSYPCLKLSLQPIVENAVIHGISKKGFGAVVIAAERQGDRISLSIRDNGVGLSKEKLEALRRNMMSVGVSGDHLGLHNVQQRILHYFKDSGAIRIESQPGTGTTVTVEWSVKRGDEINYH
ncbi:sensor histidine kinase [Paenibacillus humicola]|uniref:sensor histidine kinase n=1 Tax=Paenibacillus humicola TaxID=3110540 RepID=UPI00237A7580|nr:histidine kinase [Paenibacillus humicola]